MTTPARMAFTLVLISLATVNSFSQKQKAPPACSTAAFTAFRHFPKLEYECPEDTIVSDDKILKLPQRIRALSTVMQALERFNDPAWWRAGVDELNACALHGEAGELTDEQKQSWKSGDYSFELFGNNQMRLVLVTDPCYQTGFSGSNAFLLYRKNGRVFVSQLLNGYYSRVDNSVGIDFAVVNGRQLIEVATANSMPPSFWNYYFEIDPATHKALPKNLFLEGRKVTNNVYSEMLMADPDEVGLPKNASELKILVNGRLAQSFSAYEISPNNRGIDANGRKLRRIIYRWNGRYYSPR
jgi:hypothetical protein